jgi:hypothetical protein
MVLVDMPWFWASFRTVAHLSLATSATTLVTKVRYRTFLLQLKPMLGHRFPLLNFFNDLIQLHFLQRLVVVDCFHSFFNFLEHLPVTARAPSKLQTSGTPYSGGGEGKRVTGGPATANQLIGGGGRPKKKLLVIESTQINILSQNLSTRCSFEYRHLLEIM